MAKWSDLKQKYQEQTNIWIKIPRDLSLYKDGLTKEELNDIDCFEFLFKQFDKNQVFDLISNQMESDKELVKKQIGLFIENIVDWKNIKVDDLLKNGDMENLEYDKDAVDEFIANNFFIVPVLVKEISNAINDRRTKITEQKKT